MHDNLWFRILHAKKSTRERLYQGSDFGPRVAAIHCLQVMLSIIPFLLIFFMHLIPCDYQACWILAGLLIALLLFFVCLFLNEVPPWIAWAYPTCTLVVPFWPDWDLLSVMDMSKVQEGGDICLFFRGWISSPTSHFCTCLSCQCHAIMLPKNFL